MNGKVGEDKGGDKKTGKTKISFEDVLEDELEQLSASRSPRANWARDSKNIYERAHDADLTGLAFSGGGIRSATFNLGVIQALSRDTIRRHDENPKDHGLLSEFDYLSTVSGGGYIGGWLSAWLHRQHIKQNEGSDKDEPFEAFVAGMQPIITTRPCLGYTGKGKDCANKSGFPHPGNAGFPPLEHAAVRYLRRYSNYLTPRLGLSGDMLAVVSLFMRNLVLLQLALISLVAVILVLPYVVVTLGDVLRWEVPAWFVSIHAASGLSIAAAVLWPRLLIDIGVIFLLLAALSAGFHLQKWRLHLSESKAKDRKRTRTETARIVVPGVLFFVLAAWFIVVGSAQLDFSRHEEWLVLLGVSVAGLAIYTGAWLVGLAGFYILNRRVAAMATTACMVGKMLAQIGLPKPGKWLLGHFRLQVFDVTPEQKKSQDQRWKNASDELEKIRADLEKNAVEMEKCEERVIPYFFRRKQRSAKISLAKAKKKLDTSNFGENSIEGGVALLWIEIHLEKARAALQKARQKYSERPLAVILSFVFAGALLGISLYACATLLHVDSHSSLIEVWQLSAFGPPLVLALASLVMTLHVGAARDAFDEHEREWWARLGGFVLLAAVLWLTIFSVSAYGPATISWLGNGGLAVLAGWAGTSGAAAWIASKAKSDDKGKFSPWRRILVWFAPWFFLGGLTVLLSYALYRVMYVVFWRGAMDLGPFESLDSVTGFGTTVSTVIERTLELGPRSAIITLVAVGVTCTLILLRLDLNLFSAHALYRNRLTRAFLGASRAGQRKPHPFTGFDEDDDLWLDELGGQRPIPIINTTVNMTGGDDLAWQTRRAASFAMTPAWCGYEAKSTQGYDIGGYCRTEKYAGRLSLGTAVAISGAAAGPNMGYHTSPSVAALLTAFNLRLGYWAVNPTEAEPGRSRPALAAYPLIAELTGSATAESSWINLSDGGHFDNLGIYELVRRRCRLIVVTDAGCDPKHQFEDLANTIRKCWTDFGVDIQFSDMQKLKLPDEKARHCQSHIAVGQIIYSDVGEKSHGLDDNRARGVIVYLKCSLTEGERIRHLDIRQYADTHPEFPHETTADQYFDENQFEAYRHLGFRVGQAAHHTINAFLGRAEKPGVSRQSLQHVRDALVRTAPQTEDTSIS